MSLSDIAAADLAIAIDDWGYPCVIVPDGGALLTEPVAIIIGDPAETMISIDSGTGSERRAQGTASTAAVRSALAALGIARSLRRGDVIAIAVGDFAGRWKVDNAAPAAGDRTTIALVESSRTAARAPSLAK